MLYTSLVGCALVQPRKAHRLFMHGTSGAAWIYQASCLCVAAVEVTEESLGAAEGLILWQVWLHLRY